MITLTTQKGQYKVQKNNIFYDMITLTTQRSQYKVQNNNNYVMITGLDYIDKSIQSTAKY